MVWFGFFGGFVLSCFVAVVLDLFVLKQVLWVESSNANVANTL